MKQPEINMFVSWMFFEQILLNATSGQFKDRRKITGLAPGGEQHTVDMSYNLFKATVKQ